MNYLDTAPNYGHDDTGYAEEKMGPAIRELRDKFFLVTKTEQNTYEGTWRLLRQSLKRMQTDHIDLVHLHNFGDADRWGDHKLVFGDRGAMAPSARPRSRGWFDSSAPPDIFIPHGFTRRSTVARSTS